MIESQVQVQLVDSMGSDANVVNAARVSFAKEISGGLEMPDIKLLKYLAKHNHWSPFAHTSISVRCKVPIFLARQLVKHQVGGNWNEESRRYIDGPVEFYFPEELHTRPDSVKQGSGGVHQYSDRHINWMRDSTAYAYRLYHEMVADGVAPEEARMILPLNAMTNFIWTGSVLFFSRVVQQRADSHAQLVAQEYAAKLASVVQDIYPFSWSALNANS